MSTTDADRRDLVARAPAGPVHADDIALLVDTSGTTVIMERTVA